MKDPIKEVIIVSGKGGTGKTSLVAALASLVDDKVLCDADVDAADLHLITAPKIVKQVDFQSGHTAVINPDRCSQCGICRDMCRWNAISEGFEVDSIACEGCGVCVYFCPENTIDFPVNTCGQWYISDTRFGPMVHARLGIAEENSGKLVALVRREARKLAEQMNHELIITDGPPGIGCPAIAAIGGSSAVLIVTEPTVSGQHDMQRVAELAAHFKVPAMVCINKYDLNPAIDREIEQFAKTQGLAFLGRIAFDPIFIRAMVQGQSVVEYNPGSTAGQSIQAIWENILKELAC